MSTIKNSKVIVDSVVLLDKAESGMIAHYHAIGVAYGKGVTAGEWDSHRSCLAAIKDATNMIIALSRLQRGIAIANAYKTAKDAQAAFDSARFGTSLSSFLHKACGMADPNAGKGKGKGKAAPKAIKVTAKDKAAVTALAAAVGNADLRKAILALIK